MPFWNSPTNRGASEEIATPCREHSRAMNTCACGVVGVAVIDLASGETLSIRGDERFPTASNIKIPVLIELFTQVARRANPALAPESHWESVAHICQMLEGAPLGIELAAAHFDHRIRKGSEREAALVASYCSRLGIELLAGSGDVPARSKASAQGIEESARNMRYAFLESAARQWGAASVALGHNRDDQVETILHHMIRGSGWRGLAGMPVRRGIFIRPVLACGRDELKTYLRAMRVRYAADPSNRDNVFLRNRIRNRLVPMLRKDFNPSIDDSIIRIGENILEGWQALSIAAKIDGTGGKTVEGTMEHGAAGGHGAGATAGAARSRGSASAGRSTSRSSMASRMCS